MATINGVGRVGWLNYTVPVTSSALWIGLTNYYSGDSTANDLKGSSNVTLTNGATYSTGKINNGFSFDGVNDALVLTSNPLADSNTIANSLYKSFSISCWIKPTALGGGIFNTQNVNDGFRLITLGDGRMFYRGFYGAYGNDDIYTSNCLAIGNSYHIVVVHEDGVGTKIYCNDVLVGSSSSTSKQYYVTSAQFRIGGDPIHGYMSYFYGVIDEFGLWNRAITLSEKTELYNSGAGKQYVGSIVTNGLVLNIDAGNMLSYTGTGTAWTDLSGNGNNATLVNGVGYSSANGGTLVFDGVNDYVTGNTPTSINLNNDLTIESLVKFSSISNTRIIEIQDANYSIQILVDGSSGLFATKHSKWETGTLNRFWNSANGSVWYNITCVFTPSTNTTKLYQNGIEISSTSGNNVGIGNQPNKFILGVRSDFNSTTYLNGSLSITRIYNRALSSTEVLQNFNATKSRFGL
jgi:hypothetical protein